MTTKRHLFLFRLTAAATLACTATSTLLGACATNESAAPFTPDASISIAPEEDAGLADADADTCTTDDCAYFPAACAPDTLCPSGPFNAEDPASGLDWRTRINVVVGRSASDVWYAGAAGAVGHFDGTSWTASDVGTRETQNILWLLDSAEVLIGTPNSPSRIYTRGLEVDAGRPGSTGGWTHQPKLNATSYFGNITAAWSNRGSTTLWVSATHALWRIRLTPESTFEVVTGIPASECSRVSCRTLRSLHGASSATLWAVGDLGTTARITNADEAEPIATAINSGSWMGLRGVWAASDTDVWAVGGAGTILRYAGALGWERVSDVPTTENLNAVWGTSPTDIWAVGNAGVVLHYDGAHWSRVKVAGVGDRRPDLFTVWTPAPGRVWAGGDGILLALGEQP